MAYNPNNPLVVQSDRTMLLEVENPAYEAARDEISRFAELEKSPEYVHTYRISPLSLWNAAASGLTARFIIESLERYSKFDVPENIKKDVIEYTARYGRLKLLAHDDSHLALRSDDRYLITEISHNKGVQKLILGQPDANTLLVSKFDRGRIKQALIKIGFPVEDLAGYVSGAHLDLSLREVTLRGKPFALRDYQREAVEVFYAGGGVQGGSGVIVLPCGAGKTMVGLGVMDKLQCETLILTTGVTAVRQWISELLDKTHLERHIIGEYTGEVKEIRPVTVTTYQTLVYRKRKTGEFPHFAVFNSKDWGLIIYDEVHLLPAEVFRITADIQARRRLGLTATLVREDGREEDVFSLIGPKKYDVPWKVLEKQQWIATAECCEVRVNLAEDLRLEYAVADDRDKFRIASKNPEKLHILEALLYKHAGDHVIVIGQFIDQLKEIAWRIGAPIITGATPSHEREKLYGKFKSGEISVLVVSRVANFAVDLPDANVAIEVSGMFGSRQEEAQRLGRVLRPKLGENVAHFYSLVTRDTREQYFAAKRQLFLTEQGYRYAIVDAEDIAPGDVARETRACPMPGKVGGVG
ncbi:MAG TPA: DEAD/DEAH box helicase [Firmicutes bacterium]|nr:DEAD/DEAH box helicase [Bacillota bacterium]